MHSQPRLIALAALGASLLATASAAGEATANPLDAVWGKAVLYRDAEAATLQELRLVGRFHVDNYLLDSDQGDEHELLVRRLRLGAAGRMFGKLEFAAQVELDVEDGDSLYSRLTEAYLAWEFSDALRLTVGKHSVEFTLDGATSSNRLLTIDRSNVANNYWFPTEYIPGVSIGGESGQWTYTFGAFSSGADNGEFGNFEGAHFVLASVGRDFSDLLGNRQALLRLDYVRNEPDAEASFVRPFRNIASLVGVLDQGRWGVSGDLVLAEGFPGQGDGFGADALAWLNLTDRFQLVGRVSHIDGEGNNSVRLARYENVVASGRADRYQELYGGLNWFIYGHKLKLQTGLTLADARDRAQDGGEYDGLSWTTSLRVSW